ncbi:hypothetical protein AB0M62_08265, partial [Streptomyces sp. NPDC051219]
MKVVVQVKLLPSPEAAAALAATLPACNRAADAVSVVAYERGITSRNELQGLVYARVKAEFGLAAQPAVRVVKKVVDAYTALRANIRAGNLGPATSRRRRRAESKPIVFRSDAAQPYDDRILSWQHGQHLDRGRADQERPVHRASGPVGDACEVPQGRVGSRA